MTNPRSMRFKMTAITGMGLNLLAMTAPGSQPMTDIGRQSDALHAVSNTEWSAAHQLLVENPAGVDQTLAVVVGVDDGRSMAFVVIDESGRPLATQADDLNGDRTVDEVCFLLPVKAKQHRTVALLGTEAELPAAASDLRVKEYRAASWAPVRVQPSRSGAQGRPADAARGRA